MLVVAGDHEGHAGQRDSGGVVAGRAQIGHVPDVGHGQGQVHIVREQRLAAGGVAAGDDPVVGADGAVVAIGDAAEGLERGIAFGRGYRG